VIKSIKQIIKPILKRWTEINGTKCARRSAFVHPLYYCCNECDKSSLTFSFSHTTLSQLYRQRDTATQQAVRHSITIYGFVKQVGRQNVTWIKYSSIPLIWLKRKNTQNNNNGDTSYNRGDWDYFKVIQKIREQHTRKTWSQETPENSHIGHCTHSSESTNVKIQ